jgi:ketosteroid isomerase-like protein
MKCRKLSSLLSVLLACFTPGCGGTETPASNATPTPDTQKIAHDAHEAYVSAINSNDVETLLRAVTEDIVYMPPHEMSLAGKGSVRAWATAYFKAFKTNWEKTPLEFVISGDWAFEQYSYKSTDTPIGGGKPSIDIGKGINIYHRDADGRWRVARDAWNSDLPIPAR